MDLVFGVIRNRAIIDIIIQTVTGMTVERIQKKLINLVRIGVFELVFTPDRADYAIVDGLVEEAKKTGGIKAAGFVNALLRNLGRNIKKRDADLETCDLAKTVIRTAKTGCEFNVDILPGLKENPAKYLSDLFSLPEWLTREWLDEFGFEKSREICIASNRRPSVFLRPNSLKTEPKHLCELLKSNDIDCTLIKTRDFIKIEHAGDVTQLPGFDEGLFTVQDLTASKAVKTLAPQQGWTVLDLCAAPGGKTTQMAETMSDKGIIFATDIDSRRLKIVNDNSNRLGISCIKTFVFEKIDDVVKNVQCDAVLLDVPCSNTGVLSRRPEVRYRIKPQSIKELARIQFDLLNRVSTFLKSGGKICYSTCSIQKEENSEIVRQFIARNISFSLVDEFLTLPFADDIDCDGGYVAILMKN